MFLRRQISLLLANVILFQSLVPCLAVELDSIENLEKNFEYLRTYSSIPSPLSFKACPGKTAAGTLLYSLYEGKIHVLLGQRRDGANHWCNLGGGSEETTEGEEFLFNTAARETDEESNRLYCSHPYFLKNQPFIDIYNGSLLYRMYWQQTQYLSPKTLLKKMDGAALSGQEYLDFEWVDAALLLQAVQSNKALISLNNEKTIEIYPELFSTLSTLSGKIFLKNLVTFQKIKRFDKEVRSLLNRLYWANSDSLLHMKPQGWPKVHVDSEEEAIKSEKWARYNLRLSPLPIAPLSEEEFENIVFEPNKYAISPLNSEKDKGILGRSVAAHIANLVELKRHFSSKKNKRIKNPSFNESYTDLSLQVILGPDYKTPDHFPDLEDPQNVADEMNIQTFLDRYYGKDILSDGKRDVQVLETDPLFIKSIMQWSRKYGAEPIFYNATSDNLYNLFLFLTHLREYMMATPLHGVPVLRGTDLYFKDIKTMGDVIEKYGFKDYRFGHAAYMENSHEERKNLVLCGNLTALAGLKTTSSSSSSLEYVLNNHTVSPPDLGSTIQEALALSGFNNPTNKYFDSLFQQFVAHVHHDYANSIMLAIHMSSSLLDTHTYASFGGGYPVTNKKSDEIIPLSTIFKNLKNEAYRQKENPEPFEKEMERKKELVTEARLLLSPEIMFSGKVHVKAFSRFPMAKKLKDQFSNESRLVCMAMIGDWLTEENCVLDNAFYQYPAAKNLYKKVHFYTTGQVVKEKLSFEGLFHLVQHGHTEAVKEYIANYPVILEEPYSTKLVLSALKSNTPEMLQLVLTDLKDKSQLHISDLDMTKFLRIAKDSGWDHSASFLHNHHKNSKKFFPVFYHLFQPKLSLFGLPQENDLERRLGVLMAFAQSSENPQWLKDKVIDHLFTTTLAPVRDELLSEILLPQQIISPFDILSYVQKTLTSSSWTRMSRFGLDYQKYFLNILKNGDTKNLLFHTEPFKDSVLFGLSKWKVPLCKDLIEYLKEQPDVFTHKNADGLGLLAATQKAHLKGHSSENLLSIIHLYKEASFDLEKESFPSFFSLYENSYKHKDYSFELSYSLSQKWAMDLANATPKDLISLIRSCPDSRLLERFQRKIASLQLRPLLQLKQNSQSADTWLSNLEKTLQAERQKNSSIEKSKNPFSFLDSLQSPSGLTLMMEMVRSESKIIDDQFSHVEGYSYSNQNTHLQTFEDLLSNIPEDIDSSETIVNTLQNKYYFNSGIADFFKSLPVFEKFSSILETRKEELSAKRTRWIQNLQNLADANEAIKIYAHVHKMPFLLQNQLSQVEKILEPYYFSGISNEIFQFQHLLAETEKISVLKPNKNKINVKKIKNWIDTVRPIIVRKSLSFFMQKETLPYLKNALKKAYPSVQDFVNESEFKEEYSESYSNFPTTYQHPFSYALAAGKDHFSIIQAFLPFMKEQDAPALLKHLDESTFWKLIKSNKVTEVESFVKLLPWLFQYRDQTKDFFLNSIKILPKSALRHLVMNSLSLLKKSETTSRCLPYFVYLMMDGQNESIIKEALNKDPLLLNITSLDGLEMEDFLNFYASPVIAKMIRQFQKNLF